MSLVLFVSFFTLMLGVSYSAPASVNCQKEMKYADTTASFDAMVAHGLHSMTLDDLKLFDPTATEDNYIPTIDLDLRSELAIQPYAKLLKTNDSDLFLTDGMRVLDNVLTHMNEKHWDLAAFNPLERVVHAFHMREVWAHVKVELDKIGKTLPAPRKKACQCILDVENNGVMKVMRFMAMAIREPSLVYGDPRFSERNLQSAKVAQYYIPYPVYTYRFFEKETFKKSGNVPLKTLLTQNLDEAMPPLKDAASWQYWKGRVNPPPEHSRDTALFLYCAIAKAHKKKELKKVLENRM